MTKFAEFVSEQYTNLKNAYADQFPDEMGIQQSSMMISLIMSQYIHDVMTNNSNLPTGYHAALLEMITANAKSSIDLFRASSNMEAINWNDGKNLLKQL